MEKVLKWRRPFLYNKRAAVATPINLESRAGASPKTAGIEITQELIHQSKSKSFIIIPGYNRFSVPKGSESAQPYPEEEYRVQK